MKKIVFAVSCAVCACAFGKVKLASPFADGMVLQRGTAVPVWGTADAGEDVTVEFAGRKASAKAGEDGRWMVRLEPMEACKEGRTLAANDAKVEDVLVGEVWFCCGQSNTELPLVGGNPHFSDREGRVVAALTRRKLVRFVYASDYKWSETPRREAPYEVKWQTFTPENLGRGHSFSAMGVYFAIALNDALDVPVGIVGSYWGGTNIDAWTPREGYEGAPESLNETAGWRVAGKDAWNDSMKKGPVSGPQQQPTVLWNEMVESWCPMAMKGFIWYQGCHNGGEAHLYCDKMHALYKGWSRKFGNPGLKLYFVQLAPWENSWWGIQMAQQKFADEEPNAGMAVTVDVGNNDDIHPADKGPIGRRLAALALNRDYGFADIVADSPRARSARADGDKAVVKCDNAAGWYVYNGDWGLLSGFELAGEDGKFAPARLVNADGGATAKVRWQTKGVVGGTDLVLQADGVSAPKKVRYLYEKPWNGRLFAVSGLPLGPFEIDVK